MKSPLELPARILIEDGVSQKHIKMARTAIYLLNRCLTGLKFNPEVQRVARPFDTLASGQVDAQFLGKLSSFHDYNMNMLVTPRDLGAPGLRYVLGNSREGQGNFIISSARLDNSHNGDPHEFLAVAMHEAGHSLGQVNVIAPQYDHDSIFPGHCRNECVMQTVVGVSDVQKVSQLIHKNVDSSAGFCDECSNDLARITTRF